MTDSARKELVFPIFVVEDQDGELFSYGLFFKQGDFLSFGRVPAVGKFNSGYVFDSVGNVFRYNSERGWPRFSKNWKRLLESLILPGPLFKLLSFFVFYGPGLLDRTQPELSVYHDLILERMRVHEKGRDARQLKSLLSRASSYPETIRAIEWFLLHGGRRLPDGHFIDGNEKTVD